MGRERTVKAADQAKKRIKVSLSRSDALFVEIKVVAKAKTIRHRTVML